MKHITSRDNSLFKELRQLATSSQVRRKSGRTLLDGIHLCEAYFELSGAPEMAIVGEQALAHPEVQALLQRIDSSLLVCFPEALFGALSQVEHGVSLLFVAPTPQGGAHRLERNAVLLDRVQDPGNLGSVLRSAAAAGIRDVFCSPETVFAWSPKVLRAGMGSHFVLDIRENVDLGTLIANATVPVIATSSHAPASIYHTDLARDLAWLFGHEGQGVAPELLQAAALTVSIPHRGKVESLNVAASAAVCFFEQSRQLG